MPAARVAPLEECDLVMKGGITSGIVYPKALKVLSERYRFRSIGGTSAGAIAAGCAAAAELGRDTGKQGAGFDGFSEISQWLGQGDNLKRLFQADWATKPLMDVLLDLMEPLHPGGFINVGRWAMRLLTSLLRRETFGFLAGGVATLCLSSLILLAPLWHLEAWRWTIAIYIVLICILTLAGAVIGSIARLAGILLWKLPKNFYGLCTGLTKSEGRDVLNEWLTQKINQLAGLPPDGRPLTFGDLMDKGITLQMITTNLSHGRPYSLPFENRQWLFHEAELRRMFPGHVVDHLINHAHQSDSVVLNAPGFYFLPEARNIPVIVAMRMSLSFPVLLSATPLYLLRFNKKTADKKILIESLEDLDTCWFSDGGISSNFPMHLFDAWLPSRPTFGINLQAMPKRVRQEQVADRAKSDPAARRYVEAMDGHVHLNLPGNPHRRPEWTLISSLPGLFGAIWNTAQNFRDTMQSLTPSYDERIVNIRLDNDEGGLNLAMPSTVVQNVQEYGEAAAKLLLNHFDFTTHQYTRMRVFLPALERNLKRMAEILPEYIRMLREGQFQGRPYDEREAWYPAAAERLELLAELVAKWKELDDQWLINHQWPPEECFFTFSAPRPAVNLRVTPKI